MTVSMLLLLRLAQLAVLVSQIICGIVVTNSIASATAHHTTAMYARRCILIIHKVLNYAAVV
jgi:hypothetical protein